MTSYSTVIKPIADYLYQILAPIYYHHPLVLSTTYKYGSDAVYHIETYKKKDLLRTNTLFASLQLKNICTTFDHKVAIQLLQRFLMDSFPHGQIKNLSTSTVVTLVSLVLDNQFLIYNNHLYHQIKGGSSQISLVILLADIYLFYWQKHLVDILHQRNEIFGRLFDQIFFTWNESEKQLTDLILISNTNSKIPVEIVCTIAKKIQYLDVEISHTQGRLQTKVFHQSPYEPYTLPFIFDHPTTQHLTIIRATLLRAVRSCIDRHDFEIEGNYIRLSFIRNNFPRHFIHHCFNLFSKEFNYFPLNNHSYPNAYDYLRQNIYHYDHNEQIQMQSKQYLENLEFQLHCYIRPHLLSLSTFQTTLPSNLECFRKNLKRRWENDCKQKNNDIKRSRIDYIILD